MKDLHMRERIFAKLFLAHTISQMNANMDIALPNPRKINAGNNNVNICLTPKYPDLCINDKKMPG